MFRNVNVRSIAILVLLVLALVGLNSLARPAHAQDDFESRLAALEAKLKCVTIGDNELIIEGCDLHVVDGTMTEGKPNGKPSGGGSIYIGYQNDDDSVVEHPSLKAMPDALTLSEFGESDSFDMSAFNESAAAQAYYDARWAEGQEILAQANTLVDGLKPQVANRYDVDAGCTHSLIIGNGNRCVGEGNLIHGQGNYINGVGNATIATHDTVSDGVYNFSAAADNAAIDGVFNSVVSVKDVNLYGVRNFGAAVDDTDIYGVLNAAVAAKKTNIFGVQNGAFVGNAIINGTANLAVGGSNSILNGTDNVTVGGDRNYIDGTYNVVSGGNINHLYGVFNTTVGGYRNVVDEAVHGGWVGGDYSYVRHDGAWVIAGRGSSTEEPYTLHLP